jgi:hypothetical protein
MLLSFLQLVDGIKSIQIGDEIIIDCFCIGDNIDNK